MPQYEIRLSLTPFSHGRRRLMVVASNKVSALNRAATQLRMTHIPAVPKHRHYHTYFYDYAAAQREGAIMNYHPDNVETMATKLRTGNWSEMRGVKNDGLMSWVTGLYQVSVERRRPEPVHSSDPAIPENSVSKFLQLLV